MTTYPYNRYPSVNLVHSVDIYILQEMRSPHSGLLAGVLGWGCLYGTDRVIPLGAFVVGTGVAGLALGVAAMPVLGVFLCVGIGFRRSRVWQISFWCSPIVCQAFVWWGLVSVCACVWVAWLLRGWPGLSGGDLRCFLGSLCLVLCRRL